MDTLKQKKVIIGLLIGLISIVSVLFYFNYLSKKESENKIRKNIKNVSSEEGIPVYSSAEYQESGWSKVPEVDELRTLVGGEFGSDILEIKYYFDEKNNIYYAKIVTLFVAENFGEKVETEEYYLTYNVSKKSWVIVEKEDIPPIISKSL